MRRFQLLILLAVLISIGLAVPIVQAASTCSLSWDRYDADIQVNTDGTLTVTEIETIHFTGSCHKGFRIIPQSRGTTDNIVVWEGDRRYTANAASEYSFSTFHDDNGDINLTWYFPYTSNSTHVYNIQYTVHNGLLYYPKDGYDRIQWKAIPSDHAYPILNSNVTLHLPDGTPILNGASGPRIGVAEGNLAIASAGSDRSTARFVATSPLSPGDGIEIRADFQHGAIAGTAPAWQTQYDFQEKYGPIISLASCILGLLLMLGGLMWVYLRWYTRGRDPLTGLGAEYVTEPPSALPAGVVGTLVDEKADMQDIIATLIDLARRGVITMQEEQTAGFLGIGSSRDFVFKRVDTAHESNLRDYERTLLNDVVPSGERKLSDLKNSFYTSIPKIKKDLYKEVVKEGLFPSSPDSVRSRWAGAGCGIIFLAILGGIGVGVLFADTTVGVVFPFIGLGFFGLVTISASAAMPVKTRKGSEAKAAWLAFKRYLENIKQYTKIEEATAQFDKYLPYAIAFGIDRSWINTFAQVNTPVPIWYHPYWYGGPIGSGTPMSGGGVGSIGTPSVQGMSNSLAGSLQSMSTGLTSMLNSAASTFTSHPSSSGGGGGGWSGGGFSGGGGGGGGSAGFG
jgi:uncharacterized membrane protein YgcG